MKRVLILLATVAMLAAAVPARANHHRLMSLERLAVTGSSWAAFRVEIPQDDGALAISAPTLLTGARIGGWCVAIGGEGQGLFTLCVVQWGDGPEIAMRTQATGSLAQLGHATFDQHDPDVTPTLTMDGLAAGEYTAVALAVSDAEITGDYEVSASQGVNVLARTTGQHTLAMVDEDFAPIAEARLAGPAISAPVFGASEQIHALVQGSAHFEAAHSVWGWFDPGDVVADAVGNSQQGIYAGADAGHYDWHVTMGVSSKPIFLIVADIEYP